MSDLALIERRIGELKAELAELETAAQVVRRLKGKDAGSSNGHAAKEYITPPPIRGFFTDDELIKTKAGPIPDSAKAHEAAACILEADDSQRRGLHYRDVCARAKKAGWGGNEDSLRRSLNMRHDLFEARGSGKYRLRKRAADEKAASDAKG